jgi:tRNA dimethylallyltransferase
MVKVAFIIGCTAVGKGSTARELARRLGALGPVPHIISVDSMKVYRRMDIGTAKPSPQARAGVPHHCIDIVEPSSGFSVAQYVEHADAAIAAAQQAGAPAICVGGTSLYIQAMAQGLFEGAPGDQAARAALVARAQVEGLAQLHRELARLDPEAAGRIHPNDERRIIRALEVQAVTGKPISQLQRQWDAPRRLDCVVLGLRRDKDDLSRRINLRVKLMFEAGLRAEVERLLAEPPGLSRQAAQAVGYAEMIEHLQGRCSLEEAFENIKVSTRRLARKQRTWHRRLAGRWLDLEPEEPAAATACRVEAALREAGVL